MKKLFIANWKMHKTTGETIQTLNSLKDKLKGFDGASVGVAPPFTSLFSAKEALSGSNVSLCSQNVHFEEKGAFTGEISPVMLKDLGVKYCIVGHSERRHVFGETDEMISKKVSKLLEHEITPVLCIGETKEQRDKGKTFDVLKEQLNGSLSGAKLSAPKVVVAYEPVWAIGTGDTATPETAEEAHKFVRDTLSQLYSQNLASETIILYGGSVKPQNAADLMKKDNINGALIGGASLEADSFNSIIRYE